MEGERVDARRLGSHRGLPLQGNAPCHTIFVYCVTACRGVLHTPLPHPREFSSFCSIMQHVDVVGVERDGQDTNRSDVGVGG